MNESRHGGIMEVIEGLRAQRASGKLQVNMGMTEGSLFFKKGQLIDAKVGKLHGFQAINAIASVSDAVFNFDSSINLPTESSITASERRLLKDFFGIEAGEPEESIDDAEVNLFDEESMPAQVVSLDDVTDLIEAEPIAVAEPQIASKTFNEPHPDVVLYSEAPPDDQMLEDADEVTLVKPKAVQESPLFTQQQQHSRSTRWPLFLAIVLLGGMVGAAVVLVRQRRQPEPTAAVAPITPRPTETPLPRVSTETSPATVPTQASAPSPSTQPPAPEAQTTNNDVRDLCGDWSVVNTVEQSSYEAYKSMKIGFRISISQEGNEFSGTGEKISENGRNLAAGSRTPIALAGKIDGDKVEATFVESGSGRKTNGRFVWRVDKTNGVLTGTFVSSAARTQGRSAARSIVGH